MKTEDKEVDINEMAITFDVDKGLIDKIQSGEISHLTMEIDESNQNLILENIDGHLVLVMDEMPDTFHGCYLYNNGEFPYVIKESLLFFLLNTAEDDYLVRIIGIEVESGKRFKYEGAGKPIVEDPDGDSCIWELSFEVVPVPKVPKHYLMRWNPSISSFKVKDYEECVANMQNGMFRLNWSIYEWQEARRGDFFYMMRVGDDNAGIAFCGQFTSDPYPADDWAGTTKRRMYVDMVCMNEVEPGEPPFISLEKLQTEIPEYEWAKGHSGALLSDEVYSKLKELFDEER